LINTWNSLRTSSRRFLAAIIARMNRLGPVDNPKASWAESVESYASVPDFFKSFFEPYRTGGLKFPYAVLTPNFEGYLHPTMEKLICDMGREICVLERNGNSFNAKCYPLEGISYVEMRSVLLDSHIKIIGVTGDGVFTSSTLRFNTVSDARFTPLLNKIRRGTAGSTGAARSSESEIFDSWRDLDFKFMNFARRSLLEGEKVCQAVLQPEIRERVRVILGMKFSRRISPTLVCILTDRELITIREEEEQVASEKYGGIWNYIPLDKIRKMSLIPRSANLLVLSIQLPCNDHLECVFQSSVKREVDQLIDRFRELNAP
jgi:hypothetical protein